MSNESVDLDRGLFGGGFSVQALLGSVALHLAAVFVVLVFAADRHGPRHDVVRVDLSNFTPPGVEKPQAERPPAKEAPSLAPSVPTAAPPNAREVAMPEPRAQEPSPPPEPVRETAQQEAAVQGPVSQAVPSEEPVPDRDVYQAFVEATYRRLDEATSRSWQYARIMVDKGFFGGEYHFHVLISPDGWSSEVQFIPGKSSILFNSSLDAETRDRHIGRFIQLFTADVRAGTPYPATPPSVPLKPFCYSVRAFFRGEKR